MFGPGAVLDSFQSSGAAPKLLRGAITYVAGTTGAIGATTLFTVTGDVLVTMVAAKCTTDLTSGGVAQFTLGFVGAAGAILNVAYPDVTGWDAGEWIDSLAGGYTAGAGTPLNKEQAQIVGWTTSANVIQTISGATITGGVVRWYLQYVPLSADGLVTLHANLVAF